MAIVLHFHFEIIGDLEMSCRRSQGSNSNSYFTRRTPRTPPRATEFHFSFILLFDTAAADVVGLIVRTLELDQLPNERT